ncbi:MAG TPA: LON peptidase substrate-binding domain-containing protein [Candidatus Acidoferrum sp.]
MFPLDVVLLPGAPLPLHIFEPRYRRMVNRCLETQDEFGVLLAMPRGVVRVGCTARIVEVLNRHSDGRMDILTVGSAPFRVLELFTVETPNEEALVEGHVDYLEDHSQPADPPHNPELVELYETCHTIIFGDYPKNLSTNPSARLSYIIAATLPLDLLWKQRILELRSETDRQERLTGYLREWAPHLQKREKTLRQAAGGNGNGLN